MKLTTLMFALVSGLAFSSPAYAACDGLEGKELKKCEKEEKKKAKESKQDDRSTPLLPSQIDAKFASLDADNPFATDEYRVRVGETGFEKVDAFLMSAAVLKGKVVMARYMIDSFDAMDPAQAKESGEALVALLGSVADDAKKVADDGKGLADPETLKSLAANPMEIPKLLKLPASIMDAVDNAVSAGGESVEVLGALKAKLGG